MAGKLGIVAGGGNLPRMLIDACRNSNRDFHVFALEGQAEAATVEGVPHDWFRLGAGGAALKRARELSVHEVVLAGSVKRPSFASLRPDWKTLNFLMRVGAKGLGDDGLLRRIIEGMEEEGLTVIGVDTVLGDLKPAAGVLGRHEPDEVAAEDIARGRAVLRAMSDADVGQAVVVQQGMVLGVEAIEGTDALIERCGVLRREGPGGVLVKLPKQGQEKRTDLPTIGPETIERAAAAGLRGIAIAASATIIVRREDVVRAADAAGLFLIAVETG
jgi:UDP-2,3-diacylglucosamine hydrolase